MSIRTAALMLLALAGLVRAQSNAAPENFVIGQSVELTGQATGKENMLGALACFSWLNAHGGVHGHAIELRSHDDKRDRATTRKNTEKLLHQNHALALFGYRSTPTVEAVLPLLQEEKGVLVAPFSGARTLHEPVHPYVFNLRASYQSEAAKMVESLTTLQIARVAILAQDDAFGRNGLAGFERSLKAHKLKPLVIAKYDRGSQSTGGADGVHTHCLRRLHQAGSAASIATAIPEGGRGARYDAGLRSWRHYRQLLARRS